MNLSGKLLGHNYEKIRSGSIDKMYRIIVSEERCLGDNHSLQLFPSRDVSEAQLSGETNSVT